MNYNFVTAYLFKHINAYNFQYMWSILFSNKYLSCLVKELRKQHHLFRLKPIELCVLGLLTEATTQRRMLPWQLGKC